ncbi:glycoside hydrolase family 28 protein [Pedobacter sp. SYP-B3415]|uniref:glycoside hydrolase family 28 protein n=1 Tax=Pedobacter sp. SYP-B3415 TaxID=2496641 RepID=UPI00101DD910|nr:glycoside hydrolase family 28 protein [Pedobacter sp. SYP-B3415]
MNRLLITLAVIGAGCLSLRAQHAGFDTSVLPAVKTTSFKNDTLNIMQYGAKTGHEQLNTAAIQQAIDKCHHGGGGVVHIPNGLWISGPLQLKSNVNLHLDAGALLLFSADKTQYKLIAANWEGQPAVRNQSPISAESASNIAITGKGIIDGNGDVWRAVKKEKITEGHWKKLVASGGLTDTDGKTWLPSESYAAGHRTKDAGKLTSGKTVASFADMKDFFRPNLLVFNNCRKVLLQGVTFQNSAAWNLHTLLCEDLIVKDIQVKNPAYAQNGDGIDIESCKNVLIESSTFDVGDDGICIKSGRDAAGRARGIATENVLVRNCRVYRAHGGFVVGSEMSGGARNLFVTDCQFIGTDIGLRFKTTRGRGGVVEKVYAQNIVMKDIPGAAILFDMYYMAKDPVSASGEKDAAPKVVQLPVTEETPQFRNFRISNIVCDGADQAVFVRGLPEMNIQDIEIDHAAFRSVKGIELTEAKGIRLSNIRLSLPERTVPVRVNNTVDLQLHNIAATSAPDESILEITGGRSKDIRLTGPQALQQLKNIRPGAGVTGNAVN